MGLAQEPNIKKFLYCSCGQFCPTKHPRIDEWFSWHSKNCRPRPRSGPPKRAGEGREPPPNSEMYYPWVQTHIQMSDQVLDGYDCVLSDQELRQYTGAGPGSNSGGSRQGPY